MDLIKYNSTLNMSILYIKFKQSSAKSLTFENTIDVRSFICKSNRIGHKTVPLLG